jgi:isoleucyl-tRNA synthetase
LNSARNSEGLKVRQPLAKVLVYAGSRRELGAELVEIVTDELNVKDFEFVQEARQLVDYQVLPDNKLLGPRFGAQFPKVRAALSAADAETIAEAVQAGSPVHLEVDGETVELEPEEVLVQTQPAEGLAVASDRQVTVALDTAITPELRAEGLAREIVRRVQAMRKNAAFNIEDRIQTYYQASGDLRDVFEGWGDYIQAETLSTDLIPAEPPDDAHVETHKIDGAQVTLGVKRNHP